MTENVATYARIRPYNPAINEDRRLTARCIDEDKILNQNGDNEDTYNFTKVFDMKHSTEKVFKEAMKPLLDNKILKGINSIFIVYGQSGSGKSYTLIGEEEQFGLLPMSLKHLLKQPEVKQIYISSIEAYGVKQTKIGFYDLVKQLKTKQTLKNNNKFDPYSPKYANSKINAFNAEKEPITPQNCLQIISKLQDVSHMAPTLKNPHSSRGHTVYFSCIKMKGLEDVHFICVDLAGSEGMTALGTKDEFVEGLKMAAEQGKLKLTKKQMKSFETMYRTRKLEAGCINNGLTQIQSIFGELVRKKMSKSKGLGLRKILSSFITNKSAYCVLFTLSASANNSKVTKATLTFAKQTQLVKVKTQKAKKKIDKDAIIKELNEIIEGLKEEMNEKDKTIADLRKQITNNRDDREHKIDDDEQIDEEPLFNRYRTLTKQLTMAQEEEAKWTVNIDDSNINHANNTPMVVPEDKLKAVFNQFDADGNDSIDNKELQNALKSINQHLTIDEVNEKINEVDTNHDGEIDFDEFKIMVRKPWFNINAFQNKLAERIQAMHIFNADGDDDDNKNNEKDDISMNEEKEHYEKKIKELENKNHELQNQLKILQQYNDQMNKLQNQINQILVPSVKNVENKTNDENNSSQNDLRRQEHINNNSVKKEQVSDIKVRRLSLASSNTDLAIARALSFDEEEEKKPLSLKNNRKSGKKSPESINTISKTVQSTGKKQKRKSKSQKHTFLDGLSTFLDGLFTFLDEKKIKTNQMHKLMRFLNEQQYDTDSLMTDTIIDKQSNIKHEIEDNTFNVLINYIDAEKLKELKNKKGDNVDIRFNELLNELQILKWHKYQIRLILNWFYENRKRKRYEYDDMNEEIFAALCNEQYMKQLLPTTAATDLFLSYENVNNSEKTKNTVLFINESNCSINSCESLRPIIVALNKYKETNIKIYEKSAYQQLLNQFHHILFSHLKSSKIDDFAFIYDECRKYINCDVTKCEKLKRNYRNIALLDANDDYNKDDGSVQLHRDLLDTIHCHFIHSVDIGYHPNLRRANDDNKDDEKGEDLSWLNSEQKQRYCSTVIESKKQDPSKTEDGPENFSFGHRHYYWYKYKYNDEDEPYFSSNYGYKVRDWYIDKKYDSIKEETLNNQFEKLNMFEYNNVILKSKEYLHCNTARAIKCRNSIYGIAFDTKLKMENILAVALYTDHSKLSRCFSETFRKEIANETDGELKARNSEFFNWSKILRETVECYGTSFRDINESATFFYHGINRSDLKFCSYIAYFAAPTSCTVRRDVAMQFTDQNGMILELEKNSEYGWDLNFLDCSWISCHPEEEERLFFGGMAPLSFYSIFEVKANKNYVNSISSLKLLTAILNGKKMNTNDVGKKIYKKIKGFMDQKDYGQFANELFSAFAFYQTEIRIDLRFVTACYPKIRDILFLKLKSRSNSNLPLFNYLCKVFKYCKSIKVYEVGKITRFYIDELIEIVKEIKKINQCKLQEILLYGVQYNKKYFPDPFTSVVTTLFNQNSIKMKITSITGNRCDIVISTLNKDILRPSSIHKPEEKLSMDENDTTGENLDIFEHGIAFSYWETCQKYPRCKPKYQTLQEEMMENETRLQPEEFEQAMTITQNIENNQWKAIKNGDWNIYTGIRAEQIISDHHILSIVLFTNYPRLCTEMRRVCRRMDKEETVKQIKKRHRKYVNWIKLLCECVMVYGENAGWKQRFYHGLTEKLLFEKFQKIEFHQPISMTTRKSGTDQFIGDKGIILKFECLNKKCMYFDTKNISSSPHENEVLFFHSSMKLLEIYDKSNINYINTKPLILMEQIINGENIDTNITQNKTEKDLIQELTKLNEMKHNKKKKNDDQYYVQKLLLLKYRLSDKKNINETEMNHKINTPKLRNLILETSPSPTPSSRELNGTRTDNDFVWERQKILQKTPGRVSVTDKVYYIPRGKTQSYSNKLRPSLRKGKPGWNAITQLTFNINELKETDDDEEDIMDESLIDNCLEIIEQNEDNIDIDNDDDSDDDGVEPPLFLRQTM